ncbi:MAG: PepSY domain-containing protein [Candidatus Kapabacteria bacterium]|nr:PepSY domain-containing protein [Candidatus Kapabacteria bacterium]
MRRYHRVISFVIGIFLTLITVTGILLHVREFMEEEESERSKPSLNLAQGLPPEWATALSKGLQAVYAQDPNVRIERIRIDVEGEKPRLVIQSGAGEERKNYIIGMDGTILKAQKPEKNLLLRLHTGEIIGEAGEGLNMLFGVGLLALLITGFVMLVDYFRAAPDSKTAIRRIFGLK